MASKPNKRGSVEIQQLTMWKHQQNLEEIKMLKANSGLQSPVAAPVNKTSLQDSQSKLSKLTARMMNKTTNEGSKAPLSPTGQNRSTLDDTVGALPQSPGIVVHRPLLPPRFTPNANIDILEKNKFVGAAEGEKSDLELLLREKQQWLKSIHEDNGKMATMLKVKWPRDKWT